MGNIQRWRVVCYENGFDKYCQKVIRIEIIKVVEKIVEKIVIQEKIVIEEKIIEKLVRKVRTVLLTEYVERTPSIDDIVAIVIEKVKLEIPAQINPAVHLPTVARQVAQAVIAESEPVKVDSNVRVLDETIEPVVSTPVVAQHQPSSVDQNIQVVIHPHNTQGLHNHTALTHAGGDQTPGHTHEADGKPANGGGIDANGDPIPHTHAGYSHTHGHDHDIFEGDEDGVPNQDAESVWYICETVNGQHGIFHEDFKGTRDVLRGPMTYQEALDQQHDI